MLHQRNKRAAIQWVSKCSLPGQQCEIPARVYAHFRTVTRQDFKFQVPKSEATTKQKRKTDVNAQEEKNPPITGGNTCRSAKYQTC